MAPSFAEAIVHLPRLVLGGPPTPVFAEGHRADRGLRTPKAAVAQKSIFHMNLLFCYVRMNHRGAPRTSSPGKRTVGSDDTPCGASQALRDLPQLPRGRDILRRLRNGHRSRVTL